MVNTLERMPMRHTILALFLLVLSAPAFSQELPAVPPEPPVQRLTTQPVNPQLAPVFGIMAFGTIIAGTTTINNSRGHELAPGIMLFTLAVATLSTHIIFKEHRKKGKAQKHLPHLP